MWGNLRTRLELQVASASGCPCTSWLYRMLPGDSLFFWGRWSWMASLCQMVVVCTCLKVQDCGHCVCLCLGLSGFPEALGLPLMGLKGFGDPLIRPVGKMLYFFSVLQFCKDLRFVLFPLWRVRVEVSSWYLCHHQSPQNLVVRALRKPIRLRGRMLPRARWGEVFSSPHLGLGSFPLPFLLAAHPDPAVPWLSRVCVCVWEGSSWSLSRAATLYHLSWV